MLKRHLAALPALPLLLACRLQLVTKDPALVDLRKQLETHLGRLEMLMQESSMEPQVLPLPCCCRRHLRRELLPSLRMQHQLSMQPQLGSKQRVHVQPRRGRVLLTVHAKGKAGAHKAPPAQSKCTSKAASAISLDSEALYGPTALLPNSQVGPLKVAVIPGEERGDWWGRGRC